MKNILANYTTVQSCLNNFRIKICASVKANAYGHGIREVVSALNTLKVDYWGVASIEEALLIHSMGVYGNILCYTQLENESLGDAIDKGIEFFAGDKQYIEKLLFFSRKKKSTAKVHVMVETGMGRIGFFPHEIPDVIHTYSASPYIEIKGMCSHLSNSSDNHTNQAQVTLFEKALGSVDLPPEVIRHIANSGAIIWNREDPRNDLYYDMVRPGIMLYGASPEPGKPLPAGIKLKQAMQLVGHVAFVKKYPAGQKISYMSNFTCTRETNIAVVNMGYGDGLMRSLGGRGFASIGNKRYPIVGNVCMDMCMLNLGNDTVDIDSEVVFFGNDLISIDEQAEHADTISYVLSTQITQRPARQYIE